MKSHLKNNYLNYILVIISVAASSLLKESVLKLSFQGMWVWFVLLLIFPIILAHVVVYCYMLIMGGSYTVSSEGIVNRLRKLKRSK
ncbi:hypothetical protein DFQ00_102344 [Paenibacillus barcinonensis]|uniref:Uncharacterized protein n=1 Tax=Paenibacillus barcinonensis TaxID=198119 RepID=A0A2V4WHC2_PAEBA|nr:hypothetical protein DFQ00_102344 [Paenibacillus barcinonensis]